MEHTPTQQEETEVSLSAITAAAPALIAYQVGDTDIVAAFDPQGAIEVLCLQGGMPLSDYEIDDVSEVGDELLDSLEMFDIDEGKVEKLDQSLRQQISALTEPTYLFGWE